MEQLGSLVHAAPSWFTEVKQSWAWLVLGWVTILPSAFAKWVWSVLLPCPTVFLCSYEHIWGLLGHRAGNLTMYTSSHRNHVCTWPDVPLWGTSVILTFLTLTHSWCIFNVYFTLAYLSASISALWSNILVLLIGLDFCCFVCSVICLLWCRLFVIWQFMLSSCGHSQSRIPSIAGSFHGTRKKLHWWFG